MLKKTVTICLLSVVFGCAREIAPPVTLGGVEGSSSFGGSRATGQPGIDFGSIYYAGKRVVIWTDGKKAEGESRTTSKGITCNGQITSRESNKLNFDFVINPDAQGAVTIDGQTFDLTDGNLFLVSFSDTGGRIRQLDREFADVKLTVGGKNGKAFRTAMRGDSAFKEFFESGTPQLHQATSK